MLSAPSRRPVKPISPFVVENLVQSAINGVSDLTLGREVRSSLPANIGLKEARPLEGAHIYIDLANLTDLLRSADAESERVHQRVLRFLHLWMRAAGPIFDKYGAAKVDLQNHRLHLVVPIQEDAAATVRRAVAIADAMERLVDNANGLHTDLADARVSIGIEYGGALVVQNGTRGDRELLFLGEPANRAAHLIKAGRAGIYLGAEARRVVGLPGDISQPVNRATRRAAPLRVAEQEVSDESVAVWQRQIGATRLADFKFVRPHPPLSTLNLDTVTPGSSRRIEAAVIFADIDGYTAYVSKALKESQGREKAAQTLHVLRHVLRGVLREYGGLKVRYIGDCMVGLIAEGPNLSQAEASVVQAVRVAASLQAAFAQSIQMLKRRGILNRDLGLTVGIDYGPVTLTGIGLRGNRDQCCIGRAVLGAMEAQMACKTGETALGPGAAKASSEAVRALLPNGRPAPVTEQRAAAL
jgi:class 3 adenylate cyclase